MRDMRNKRKKHRKTRNRKEKTHETRGREEGGDSDTGNKINRKQLTYMGSKRYRRDETREARGTGRR
jgi:hypothetical protein